MNTEFWKNKTVLITGNTGFKGSWLSKLMLNAGAEVYGYALENECSESIFNVTGLEKYVECCYNDIRNLEALCRYVNDTKPQIVFHLAAQPIVRTSYLNPVETYQTNVMGTVNLFEAIRKTESVRAVVNVTTDKVYMNDDKTLLFCEGDRLGGYDPYSNSKACSELVTSSYISSFFNTEKYGKEHNVSIATARAGNVIGGGDYAKDRLIPDCIRAIANKSAVTIRNPNSVRPWQNVLEPIYFYTMLAEKLYTCKTEYSGAWNIGPNKEDCIEVKYVIDEMKKNLPDLKVVYEGENLNNLHEAKLLMLDSKKAENKLGFKNKWNISEAVKYTAIWYKSQLEKMDMNAVTDNILKEYFEK